MFDSSLHHLSSRRLPQLKRPSDFQRVSDTVPLLSVEVAAQEESFLLRRDAQIACCFGFKVCRITALRQSSDRAAYLRWELLERRWLTEGAAIHAETHKRRTAFAEARSARLRQAEDEDAAYLKTRPASGHAPKSTNTRQNDVQESADTRLSGDAPLHWFLRGTLMLLKFFSSERVILPAAGCILVYFIFGAVFPGFWANFFADAKAFLTGVTP